MEGIEVEVYPFSNPLERKNVLPGRISPTYLGELKGIGGGSVQIPVNDPKLIEDPTLIESRNVIKLRVNDKVTGAFIISSNNSVTIDEGEKAKEVHEIAGAGLKSWFDDAEVRPLGGLRAASANTRHFNFATERGEWYNEADWITPFDLGEVFKAAAWGSQPAKWPENTPAHWIWAEPYNVNNRFDPSYFRYEFSSTEAKSYVLYAACDDNADIYVNGERLLVSNPESTMLGEAVRIQFSLSAGDHVIAFQCSNNPLFQGPGALVAALFTVDNEVETLIGKSGDVGWKVNPYPLSPPAWSTAEVLLTLLDEAGARGVLFPTLLTPTFTITHDSNGNPWTDQLPWSFGVGESLSSVVGKMEELVCEVWIDPDTYELHMVKERGQDRSTYQYTSEGATARTNFSRDPAATTYTGPQSAFGWRNERWGGQGIYSLITNATDGPLPELDSYARWVFVTNGLGSGRGFHLSGNPETTTPGAIGMPVLPGETYTVSAWFRSSVATPGALASIAIRFAKGDGTAWVGNRISSTSPLTSENWVRVSVTATVPVGATLMQGYLVDSVVTVHSTGDRLEGTGLLVEKAPSLQSYFDGSTPDTPEIICGWNGPPNASTSTAYYQLVVPGSEPVIFERGKNLRRTTSESRGKIKNSLSVKTTEGWLPEQETDSVNKYGVLEGTLDTGASSEVSKALASVIFQQRATEEEGASYDIYPTDKIPLVDFFEGDWVMAPDKRDLLVRRRVMSISIAESDTGKPLYTLEFDTIFRDNEDRINRIVSKMGGGGVGGSFNNAGAGGEGSFGNPVVISPSQPPIKVPKPPTGLVATSVGKWTPNGITPFSEVTLTWNPVTEYTDGSILIPTSYEVWAHRTAATDEGYVMYALVTEPEAILQPFQPGSQWSFKVIARSPTYASFFSVPLEHTMVAPEAPMAAPDAPILSSDKGVLIVTWSGKLATLDPPPQFRYVFVEVAPQASNTFTQMGSTLARDGRDVYISGLTTGDSYKVRLKAVDGVGIQSPASAVVSHVILGIEVGDLGVSIQDSLQEAQDTADAALEDAAEAQVTADGKNTIFQQATEPIALAAGDQWWQVDTDGRVTSVYVSDGTEWNSLQLVADSILVPGSAGAISIADGAITAPKIVASEEMWTKVLGAHRILANEIQAGTITAIQLSSEVGRELDIASNNSVNILVGQINEVDANQQGTASSLETMQTYYRFDTDGAVISSPGSPFQLALRSDRIEMLEQGVAVSYWNSGQMHVRSFVGEEVILGNHKLEKYGAGTVVRKL